MMEQALWSDFDSVGVGMDRVDWDWSRKADTQLRDKETS